MRLGSCWISVIPGVWAKSRHSLSMFLIPIQRTLPEHHMSSHLLMVSKLTIQDINSRYDGITSYQQASWPLLLSDLSVSTLVPLDDPHRDKITRQKAVLTKYTWLYYRVSKLTELSLTDTFPKGCLRWDSTKCYPPLGKAQAQLTQNGRDSTVQKVSAPSSVTMSLLF